MKKKKDKVPTSLISLLFFAVLAIGLMAGGASAISQINIYTPASGGIVNGTSMTGKVGIYFASQGIANNVSINVTLGGTQVFGNRTILNDTEETNYTFKYSTAGVSDSSAVNFVVNLYNQTNVTAILLNTSTVSVKLSNTAPTAPTVLNIKPDIKVRGTQDYTVLSPANGLTLTYSTTLTDPNSGTATKTGTNPIFSGDEIPVMGTYTAVTTTTDELSRTATTTNTFTANSNTVGGAVAYQQAQQQITQTKKSNQTGTIIIVVLAVAILYFATQKKGKK